MWTDLKPKRDKDWKQWNFRIWCQYFETTSAERLFFSDDEKVNCGVVIWVPGTVPRYSHVKKLIEKLVRDQSVRDQYQRDLRFPLQRYYSAYGAFPEEFSN